jgi:hypothetical protein
MMGEAVDVHADLQVLELKRCWRSFELQAWAQLGSMPQVEAMRLFVRTLDEEQVRDLMQLFSLCISRACTPP